MFNSAYNPSIYSASKIWHNTKWTDLRDKFGFNINARWINLPCGEEGNQTGAKLLTPEEKLVLWNECQYDVCTADMVVLYCEKREEQRGALVEFGMMLGAAFYAPVPKPVYVIGSCLSIEANAISDVAFMYHPMVHRVSSTLLPNGSYDHLEGYLAAKQHYLEKYHTPENVMRNTGFLHASASSGNARLHQKTITSSTQFLRA